MNGQIEFYQVNAFTSHLFQGNPAGVFILPEWIPEESMQQVAKEANLSTSAFLFQDTDKESQYRIRWFTPTCEISLCGHATLAAGWVLTHVLRKTPPFHIKSQSNFSLVVDALPSGEIQLDFPLAHVTKVEPNEYVKKNFEESDVEGCYFAGGEQDDYFVALKDVNTVNKFKPDMEEIKRLPARGLLLSSAEDITSYQFRTRFFAPKIGINEDIATGSAHCLLASYWHQKYPSNNQWFHSQQGSSSRKGSMKVKLHQNRVLILSRARMYLKGTILL